VGALASISKIYAYPNPTQGQFRIHIPVMANTLVNYKVFDFSGKAVLSQQVSLHTGNNEFASDISNFPAGQYNIMIQGGNINWRTTIIKTK
jgi:hypothetical protein